VRHIIVGDVHGCFHELFELVEKLQVNRYEDKLYFVGDLIDKGPMSFSTVALAHSLDAEVVMGNHEEKMLRYWKHWQKKQKDPHYKIPMRFDADKLNTFENLLARPELLQWMSEFKPLIQLTDRLVITHGGLVPGIPLVNQDLKQICRLRYIHVDTGKMLSVNEDLSQPSNSVFWTERWAGGYDVIYGHTAARLDDVVETIGVHGHTFGIDTGCVYGGHLTALVYEHLEGRPQIVQVKGKMQYAPHYEQGGE
jgi:bis(5'-nucleosyl)-tetraphosphatase (symmetrical)